MPRHRVGIDVGGTFTDICVSSADGVVAVGKALTTPRDPAHAIEELLGRTLSDAGIGLDDVAAVVHGTTLVTNAIIERSGSPTALLATAGHRDALEIARERRYALYDLDLDLPAPLVPRHLRFDVPERTLADGTVERPVDLDHVARLGRELVEAGVEAAAIAFLHSFTNARNEQAAAATLRRVAPTLRLSLSCEIAPEIREYERTSTTAANVYVQALVERYLADLKERLRALGYGGPLHVMLSNGGIATPETAARTPVRMLESGPAAGALAAAAAGSGSGSGDLVSFDMGGTTAKLCLIEDGAPLIAHEFEVDRVYRLARGSGLPLRIAVVDMIEIGAGGGSIARIDPLGLLRVGPDSAGAAPGPACYGRGGTAPTVTDADLVLGYLGADSFLGGRMVLDLEAARRAIAPLADSLGVDIEQAAAGIHRVVDESMASAARVHAVERGRDPTRLPLYAFGGAGPVHACGVARALGASTVVSPPAAGVLSALGLMVAPPAFDFARSARRDLGDVDAAEIDGLFGEMEAEGADLLRRAGVAPGDIRHERIADMRFRGQGHEIRVPVAGGVDGLRPEVLHSAFARCYRAQYGREGPAVPVEALTWRVVSHGPRPDVRLQRLDAGGGGRAVRGERPVWFGRAGGFVPTPVLDREGLTAGAALDGPAIVEERESTLVIPPGARARVLADGSIRVELEAA